MRLEGGWGGGGEGGNRNICVRVYGWIYACVYTHIFWRGNQKRGNESDNQTTKSLCFFVKRFLSFTKKSSLTLHQKL